jgi:hypothetical protein
MYSSRVLGVQGGHQDDLRVLEEEHDGARSGTRSELLYGSDVVANIYSRIYLEFKGIS